MGNTTGMPLSPLQIAQKALDAAWNGRLPLDPALLASGLLVKPSGIEGEQRKCRIVVRGVAANVLDGASSQVNLEEAIDGLQYACLFNNDEDVSRNRFAVAHEIGHILLGHVRAGEAPLRHSVYGDTTPEMKDANAFAAALLIPERHLRSVFDAVESVQQMTDVYGVSSEAAIYRLKALRLI